MELKGITSVHLASDCSMSSFTPGISVCRHCQHYQSEGRRGGHCGLLSAPVQASWAACSMASPCFTSNWERLQVALTVQPGAMVAATQESVKSVKESLHPLSLSVPVPVFITVAADRRFPVLCAPEPTLP